MAVEEPNANIDIASTAPPGTYPLFVSNYILATPEGQRVPGVTATNGSVIVAAPALKPTPTLSPLMIVVLAVGLSTAGVRRLARASRRV